MTVLAWIGLGVGVAGLVLAVASLSRDAPTYEVGQSISGTRTLVFEGPGDVILLRVWVEDAGGEHRLNSEHSQVEVHDADGAPLVMPDREPFGRGTKIPAQYPYSVTMNVNRTLWIRYRAAGWLGFLSRSKLRIIEGP